MNTLIYHTEESSGNVGVGFAIPVNKIERIVGELKENGKVERDFWTGLSIRPIDEQIASVYDLKSKRGVIITEITKNSPAQKAGLKVEDIITEINTYRINDPSTIIGIINDYRAGDKLNLKILRDGKEKNIEMKLEKSK
jgi:serine protease Do